MTKKQKIIIAISFLLFIFPSVSSAGCFGNKPIIDKMNFGCISVFTNICKSIISLNNNCDESFYYYDVKNCSSPKITNQTLYFRSIISKVNSFIHDDFIEIPPNWRLVNSNEDGTRSICGSSKEGYGDCVDIHCDMDSITSNEVSINFGIDSSRQYTIKGHYDKDGKIVNNNKKTNIPFVILIISIFLFMFFTAVLITQKYKTKNKKK